MLIFFFFFASKLKANNDIHNSLCSSWIFALTLQQKWPENVNLPRVFVRNWPTTVKKRAVYLRCVISSKYLYLKIYQCVRFHYEFLNTLSRNSKKECLRKYRRKRASYSPATRLEKCSLKTTRAR